MRSVEDVVRLWQDGYSAQVIARRLRMSPQTVYSALKVVGSGQIPERPWAGPKEIGIGRETLVRWAKLGVVRQRGSRFHKADVDAYVRGMENRQCAHWKCENPVGNHERYVRFCPEHRRNGVDPEYVLVLLRRMPGLSTARIYLQLSVRAGVAIPVLEGMVADGLLREEPISTGGRRFYVADTAPEPT